MGTTTKKSSGKKVSVQKASSRKSKKKSQKNSCGVIVVIVIIVIAVALLYLFGPRETMTHLVYDHTGIVLPEALPWEYQDVVVSDSGTASQAAPQLSEDLPQGLAIPLCAHTADSHEIHKYLGFSLCYREKYEQAEWVAYEINTAELVKEASRTDDFRSDPKISTGSATLADYKGSGYDRGHLAPAADMAYSKETMSESFYMSNMSPQTGGLNRGVWKDLEAQVREWAEEFGSVYVISGPVLEKDSYPTIGENQVAVPEYYYKVLFAPKGRDGNPAMIGFLMPNQKLTEDYYAFAVPVDEIERRTGLDFFHSLDKSSQDPLESHSNPGNWK